MQSVLYTWGTGAAWGRELGHLPTDKKARHHTSLSLLVGTGDSQTHFLIDVGVPCVETMIDAVQEGNRPIPPPDAVFITHSHFDHNADLTKLVFSRERGWIRRYSTWTLTDAFFDAYQHVLTEDAVTELKGKSVNEIAELHLAVSRYVEIRKETWKHSYVQLAKSFPPPLPVIATDACINDPTHGIKKQFGFVSKKLLWQAIPESDAWYGIAKESGCPVPWAEIRDTKPESVHPILFKSLPVRHGDSAPGACLYIFRILDAPESGAKKEKRVVISGDFASIDATVIQNPDLRNPDLLLIENNTVNTDNAVHTNWIKNKALLSTWFTPEHAAKVLLYHLSGFDDWEQGYAPRTLTDTDWREVCRDADFQHYHLDIDIAEDGNCYAI